MRLTEDLKSRACVERSLEQITTSAGSLMIILSSLFVLRRLGFHPAQGVVASPLLAPAAASWRLLSHIALQINA